MQSLVTMVYSLHLTSQYDNTKAIIILVEKYDVNVKNKMETLFACGFQNFQELALIQWAWKGII